MISAAESLLVLCEIKTKIISARYRERKRRAIKNYSNDVYMEFPFAASKQIVGVVCSLLVSFPITGDFNIKTLCEHNSMMGRKRRGEMDCLVVTSVLMLERYSPSHKLS